MRFLDQIKWIGDNKRDAIAFYDDVNKPLTFGKLDELSGKVYGYLSSKNIAQEDFVFICLPRGYTPLVVAIGVLKAGAAFVICEEDYPKERIAFIKKDCGSKLTIDRDAWEEILAYPTKRGYREADKRSAAFAVYTSGTTGTPKGVLHEYGNIDRIIDSHGNVSYNHGNAETERFALTNPLNFVATQDLGIFFICRGVSVDIVAYETLKNPQRFKEYLVEHKITCMFIAPSMLKNIDVHTPYLKDIVVAGEQAVGIAIKDYTLHNLYGMSETGFTISSYQTTQSVEVFPVGKPQFDLEIKLLDENGNESDNGELCFFNPYVRGYINRPEENEKAFRNGLFYTGDLARRQPDGNYVLCGRLNETFKINGNRVEPAEIESVAKKVLALNWAAVKAVTKDSRTYVCLYYTDDIALDVDVARDSLAEFLPYYMLPSRFIHIDDVPRNANGKFDRKALPDPRFDENTADYVAPTNKTEQALCNAFAQALKLERVGVNDDFLSLGGDSLSAIKLIGECDLDGLSVKDIFKYRTPKKIIENYQKSVNCKTTYEKRDFYPITENQRGVFIECELDKSSTKYNVPMVVFFEHATVESICSAIKRAVDVHPALKTRFEVRNGEIVQRGSADMQLDIGLYQVDNDPDEKYFEQFVKPFNLLTDVLCRFNVVESSAGAYLFCDVHHIIFDGLSSNILINDISKILNGEEISKEVYTAFDRAFFEEQWMNTEDFNKAEEYFKKLASGAEVIKYPHFSKPDAEKLGKSVVRVRFGDNGIKDFCRKSSITQSSFFITAFANTLHRITREDNIVFSSVNNGRNYDMQNTIGMFVKTIPVVSRSCKDTLFIDSAMKMQNQLSESISMDIYPYHKIVSYIGSRPEIIFAYQGGIEGLEKTDDKNVMVLVGDSIMPISVLVYPKENDRYEIKIEYDASVYGRKDIELLANAFRNFAINSAKPQQRLCDISMISDEEKEGIIALSRGETLDYDKNETFPDMVKKQAQIRPDAIAVVDNYSRLTYAELEEQSNRIATYLIEKGIKPNDFVCITLPRKKEFIVSVLGVMRAGAAYVPVDMDYPEERKQYMIEDSASKVVITENLFEEALRVGKTENSVNLSKPNGRAYMIYTSGSTGKPKGVVVRHSGLRAFIEWNILLFGITSKSRNAMHPSFSFDASVADLTCPLSVGGRVYILLEAQRKDLNSIRDYIIKNRISGMILTTGIGMEMINQYPELPLSYFVMGGDKMLPTKRTDVLLYNCYGPTEFTVCSSYHAVNQDKDTDIPIGRPVPNSYSFICDGAGNLMPRGLAGELCLAGTQIAEGYWNLPEKTKEVFVDCPYLSGEKMYRTGDLCRYNEDGDLEFLGRIDHQVKLRGFRIELGEIESVASLYNGIKSVVATVIGTQLCLYYTAETEIDKADLKKFLSQSLTEYMLPTVFMQLAEMSMTPNGKINRKALPKPMISRKAYVAPTNATEKDFCIIMGETLNIEEYSAEDSFFEVGGNSISATKVLISAMAKGYNVAYAEIFKHPSPSQLAKYLAERTAADSQTSDEISQYDYSKINRLIKKTDINAIDTAIKKDRSVLHGKMGNVVLTGATGFLGIHILKEYISEYEGKVYCLVRGDKGISAENRLKKLLEYYFTDDFAKFFDDGRIICIEGELNDVDLSKKLNVPFDTVIHCAASVKHFASDDSLYRANTLGTQNILKICEERGGRFVHISTYSVSGTVQKGMSNGLYSESDLYVGQGIDNEYIRTKFLAERAVLEAALRGCNVKIIRLGNLMGRMSDGVFQINFATSGIMRDIRGIVALGYTPASRSNKKVEMSPIDCASRAVLKISDSDLPVTVYHLYNDHSIKASDIIDALEDCGFNLKQVSEEEYRKQILIAAQTYKDNAAMSDIIGGIVAYKDAETGTELEIVEVENTFTTSVLSRLDFAWPETDKAYVRKNIENLMAMGFFDQRPKI